MIGIGKTVTLYDYNEQRERSYKLVECHYDYRFVGRDFDSNKYKFKQVRELAEGGNCKDTISIETKPGYLIHHGKPGDIIQYESGIGIEKFKILSVR